MIAAAFAALLLAAAPEHKMNEPLIAALDRALKGDAQILQGFGIEEAVITAPLWDERVSVDGKGVVTFTTRRSSGDNGGSPVGVFRTTLPKEELLSLIRELRKLVAAPPQPHRSEAYETRIELSAVAGGHLFGAGAPVFPPAMEPLQPVLMPLNRAIGKALEHPVRSLTLELELPDGVGRGGTVAAVLHLKNGGEQGFWVSNPLALPNQPERDRVQLVYARPIVFTPGVSPVPVPARKVLLTPPAAATDEPRYRWLPAKGEVTVPMQAKLDPGDAKELVFRAELFAEEGADVVAGQPRLRGSVFSADLTVAIQ